MKVLVIVKANAQSEAGEMPSETLMTEMMKFNEALVNAGVMKDGDGVKPTSAGVRVGFGPGGSSVRKGPFTPSSEQLAGYWIWEVGSLDDAIEWAKKAPFGEGDQLELRPYASP